MLLKFPLELRDLLSAGSLGVMGISAFINISEEVMSNSGGLLKRTRLCKGLRNLRKI